MRDRMGKVSVAIFALVLVAAACSKSSSASGGGSGGGSSQGGTVTIGADSANSHGTKTASGSTVQVTLDNYFFSPTVIQGTPGQKLTIQLTNSGSVEHTFNVPAANIDKTLQPGGKATVTVTVPMTGGLEFYCDFHRASGMVGAIITPGTSLTSVTTTATSSGGSGSGSGSSSSGGGSGSWG